MSLIFSTAGIIIVISLGTFFLLMIWAQGRMKKALKQFHDASLKGQELIMGCKCKEKKLKDRNTPCEDPLEESFREAFLRESKKTSQLSAQCQYLTHQISAYDGKIKETLKRLDAHMDHLELYAEAAYHAMPQETRNSFKSQYGVVPKRLKVSHGS